MMKFEIKHPEYVNRTYRIPKELADKYQMAEEDFLKEFGGLDMVQYDLEMRRTLERLKELNK